MRISVVCSSREHPVFAHLARWADRKRGAHEIELVESTAALRSGDLLFLISCSEIVGAAVRARYAHTLVVHASALPHGRGWSPHIWQILEGRDRIPVTLLEAADQIDAGAVWAQREVVLEGHELYDEINAQLFAVTLQLMDFAIDNAATVRPRAQQGAATYYRRRTPADSEIDPHKSIAEQFDLLRVADPTRFPCFVEFRGRRYRLLLSKEDPA